jgi:CBS domain-containing protein
MGTQPREAVVKLDLRSSVRSTPWDEPVSVPPATTLRHVAQLLHACRIGAVIVRADDDRDAGVVSERDIVAAVADGLDLDAVIAGDVMTAGLVSVDVGDPLAAVVDAMVTHRVRHVGVTDGDEVVGVLSVRDLLGLLVTDPDDYRRAP